MKAIFTYTTFFFKFAYRGVNKIEYSAQPGIFAYLRRKKALDHHREGHLTLTDKTEKLTSAVIRILVSSGKLYAERCSSFGMQWLYISKYIWWLKFLLHITDFLLSCLTVILTFQRSVKAIFIYTTFFF